jgi:thymidylate synthase (FAD)
MSDPIPEDADQRLADPNSLARRENILGDEHSWLELQDMLPHPASGVTADSAIVSAARTSFLGHSKGADQDKRLLLYLLKHRHTTPFEQVEFKFRVRAPVVVWWQWVRHRTWSYNLQSGRYTPFNEDEFYIPKAWRQQSPTNKQGSEGLVSSEVSEELHRRLTDIANDSFALYTQALEMGVAKEQARLVLPAWTSYYVAVCKVDAWNLMHFLRLRLATEAQWEIRQYAEAILDIFREFMPWTSEAFDRYLNPQTSDSPLA